jgi:hypothetical protein
MRGKGKEGIRKSSMIRRRGRNEEMEMTLFTKIDDYN